MSEEAEPGTAAYDEPLSNYEPIQYENELQCALAEETTEAIESQPMVQLSSSATIREGIQALYESNTASLLVVDEGRLAGIFTERDVLQKVAENYSRVADQAITTVMTKDPSVVYETDPAAMALAAIAVSGHRHVPVLKIDGLVRGVLSPRRMIQFMSKHFKDVPLTTKPLEATPPQQSMLQQFLNGLRGHIS